MAQEYKIINEIVVDNGGLTEKSLEIVSTTATSVTFSSSTLTNISATTISATTYYGDGANLTGIASGSFTGGTVTGATSFTGGLSANTISATTYYGDGSNLTGIVANASFTGGTVTGATNFTGGLSANTVSATTYNNLPIASTSDLNDGTNNTKFATSLGLANSDYITQYGDKLYIVATGTNSYSGSSTPAMTALTSGCTIQVKFTNANTTTGCTFTLNSLAAKSLVKGTSTSLISGDIIANGIYTLMYDGAVWVIVGYVGVLRSFTFTRVGDVTSGTALAITLVTNDRIQRDLTGSNLTANQYLEFVIPADFISFPTNALSLDTRRNNSGCNVVVTWGNSGSTDSTLASASIVATGTGNTWETKSLTPGSTYKPGDRILQLITLTTQGNTSVGVGTFSLKYIGR